MYFDLANTDYRTQIFYTSGVWQKPPGICMVFISCIGAGGGGGGGFTRTTGQLGGGGGGGASGAIYNGLFPANSIPNMLFVTVGDGGQGGVALSAGTSGGTSYVEAFKDGGGNFVYARATGGGGGGGGLTGGVSGPAGTNTVSAVANQKLSVLGTFTSTAGQSGTVGSPLLNASPVVYANNATPLCGGAGGGAVNATNTGGQGGGITGAGTFIPTYPNTVFGDGTIGIFRMTPGNFVSMGGTGGGGNPFIASNSGNGGRGGNGNIGSGGGGGGAGTSGTGGTGGTGGNGGNGLVVIVCY